MFDAALVTKHVTENPFVLLRAIIIWHLLKIFGGYTVADVTSTKDVTFQELDFPDVIGLLTGNGSDLRSTIRRQSQIGALVELQVARCSSGSP